MSATAVIATPQFDNMIKAAASGCAWAYQASTGAMDVNFGATIGTSDAIQLVTSDGYSFAWRPDTVNVIDTAGNITQIDGVNMNAAAQVWKNKLTYVGTTAATSDEFTVKGGQLKHDVRMVAPPSLPSGYTATPQYLAIGGDIGTTSADWADVELWADGAVQTATFTTSGDLSFRLKSTGEEIYSIPAVTARDDAGSEGTGGYLVEFGANDTVTLYMLMPWDWMQTAEYPVVIDPTVIVTSGGYNTQASSRLIVRLSNGWTVVAVNTAAAGSVGSVRLYYTQDDGNTWALLAATTETDIVYTALASTGTTIKLFSQNKLTGTSGGASSTEKSYMHSFDATTVAIGSNVSATSNPYSIANGATTPRGCALTIDGTGKIWAVYIRDGAVSTNPSNVYYVTSTDGGTTWTSSASVTSLGTSGQAVAQPLIVVRSNNYPTVIYDETTSSGNYALYSTTWNGSAWGTAVEISPISTYNVFGVSALVDGSDNIFVVWGDYNSKIGFSKSIDGGSTWSAQVDITTGGSNPTIAIDANSGNLYVFYVKLDSAVSSTNKQIFMVKYNASSNSWGSETDITSVASDAFNYPTSIACKFNFNSSDAVRAAYTDTTTGAISYYEIVFDHPPNAPTLTAHSNFDATTATSFGWTFSDPDPGDTQSAYQLQIVDVAAGTTVVDTGKVASTTGSYSLAANKLTNGKQYQWRVVTWDSHGMEGAWSGYATFNTAAAPTVSITAPTANEIIAQSSLTVQFSYSDPGNNAQQSFEVKLLDSTDGTVLSDSGVVTSSGNQYTVQYTLANNTAYHLQVTATSSAGIASAVADVSITTSFTTTPQPFIVVTPSNTNAYIEVAITNPTRNMLSPDDVSFEGSLGDWGAGSNWTIAQDTAYALDGTHAMKMTRANATAGNGYAVQSAINCVVGTTYTATAEVIGDATTNGKQFVLQIQFNGGRRVKTTFTATEAWQEITVQGTAQAGETTIQVWITDDPQTAPASGQNLWVDEVMIREGTDTTWQPGGQPDLTYNDLYRRITGTATWTRIATNLVANATYDDYTAASGQGYDYKATANGANGTSVDSATEAGTVTLTGLWVHDVSNPSGTIQNLLYFYNQSSMGGTVPSTENWTPTATAIQLAGRKNPIVEFGEAETYELKKDYLMVVDNETQWNALTSMLQNQTTLCVRDGRGRVVFGNAVAGYQGTDVLGGHQVALDVTQTSYSVAV